MKASNQYKRFPWYGVCSVTLFFGLSIPLSAAQAETAGKKPLSDRPWTAQDPVSEGNLRAAVTTFNQNQKKKCEKSETPDVCENFPEIKISDSNGFIQLSERTILQPHSSGVDAGEDTVTTYVFRKNSLLERVAVADGQLHRLRGDRFAVSIEGKYSCLGYSPTGTLKIHDLKTKKQTFEHDLSHGDEKIIHYQVKSTQDSQLYFKLNLESETDATDESTTCEASHPVWKVSRTLDVRCNNDGLQCKVSEISKSKKVGCAEIGSCD